MRSLPCADVAVVVSVLVAPADQQAHDRFEVAVNARLASTGPPDGLMAHVAHPEGDGYRIVDVWRNVAAFEAWRPVLATLVAEAGLAMAEPEIRPVWSFARP